VIALITGANRGIGLELTKQYLADGMTVIGTCREPNRATALHELAALEPDKLSILALDIADVASIESAASHVLATFDRLDLLINCAGTNGSINNDWNNNPSRFLGRIEAQALDDIFRVNMSGPLLLTQALRTHCADGKIINITSSMGSKGLMNRGEWYGYRASKAGLNIISRALSFDLRDQKTIVVAMHPGWVKTDMGTADAPEPLTESVRSMRHVIDSITPEDSGKYFNWKGEILPW
jgi:NAD(P)-dependent dehydrogenase (short-subunit alcohol dehydrogenase family)